MKNPATTRLRELSETLRSTSTPAHVAEAVAEGFAVIADQLDAGPCTDCGSQQGAALPATARRKAATAAKG